MIYKFVLENNIKLFLTITSYNFLELRLRLNSNFTLVHQLKFHNIRFHERLRLSKSRKDIAFTLVHQLKFHKIRIFHERLKLSKSRKGISQLSLINISRKTKTFKVKKRHFSIIIDHTSSSNSRSPIIP